MNRTNRSTPAIDNRNNPTKVSRATDREIYCICKLLSKMIKTDENGYSIINPGANASSAIKFKTDDDLAAAVITDVYNTKEDPIPHTLKVKRQRIVKSRLKRIRQSVFGPAQDDRSAKPKQEPKSSDDDRIKNLEEKLDMIFTGLSNAGVVFHDK